MNLHISTWLVIIPTLIWVLFLLHAAYHGTSIRTLTNINVPDSLNLPPLSLIIAARNEAETIGQCLASLRGLYYPNLEVILIDDRSTDDTSAIMDRFASLEPRAKVIHIAALPAEWLGKVHALNEGVKIATGEWMLMTDADIRFEPHALAKSVGFAVANDLDHLALLPETHEDNGGFFLTLFVVAFGGFFVQRTRAGDVGKVGSTAYSGVGAFNLVRTSKFNETPGFEWLRMEVLDDVGLGLMMSRHGGKSALLNGVGLLHLEWYHSLLGAIAGLEKNAFAGFARFSFVRAILILCTMLIVLVLPISVALVTGNVLGVLIVVLCYVAVPGITAIAKRNMMIDWKIASILPLGYLLIWVALFSSTVNAWKVGGIRWRETFYPLSELRSGQRVKL